MLPTVSTTTPATDGPPLASPTGPASSQDPPTDATLPSPSVIVVHVAGAVVTPGVYELTSTARVQGAIAAADGPLPDADPNSLNLAAPLSDGSRIYVPRVGEEVPPSMTATDAPTGVVEPGTTIVDVNEATAAALEELPGVGPATATAIVAERDRNGPFLSVDDLDRVPGIGPAKIEALRELVTT
jgi:competence protein ComEA